MSVKVSCAVLSVWMVFVCVFFVTDVESSCGAAHKCCPGRNGTCFGHGPKMNGQGSEKDKCFCDEECAYMQDCCKDFNDACKGVDCEVGEWSDFGPCSNPCGLGSQESKRKIITHSLNGGRQCPVLRKRRGCLGQKYNECLQQSVEYQGRELRETGRILPAVFGKWRIHKDYNPYKDHLRKNLFTKDENEILARPTYCAKYEIKSSQPSCNNTEQTWSASLVPGNTVCVECQPAAMYKHLGLRCKGHGVWLEETEFNAIGVHGCRGRWVMLTKHDACTCSSNGDSDFILI